VPLRSSARRGVHCTSTGRRLPSALRRDNGSGAGNSPACTLRSAWCSLSAGSNLPSQSYPPGAAGGHPMRRSAPSFQARTLQSAAAMKTAPCRGGSSAGVKHGVSMTLSMDVVGSCKRERMATPSGRGSSSSGQPYLLLWVRCPFWKHDINSTSSLYHGWKGKLARRRTAARDSVGAPRSRSGEVDWPDVNLPPCRGAPMPWPQRRAKAVAVPPNLARREVSA
jgi:hypothetical protein